MKITFINPPWYFEHPRNIILSQNLGLAYLASFLTQKGHKTKIIDSLADGARDWVRVSRGKLTFYRVGLPFDSIVKRIPADSDYIGITVPFTHTAPVARQLSLAIKTTFPRIPIVIGGVYPSLMKERAAHPSIDYTVIGEGELPLLDLLTRGAQGKKILSSDPVADLDSLPFPARDQLPMETYLSGPSPRKENVRSVSLLTSRGCPFDCSFCSIHCMTGYTWRKRSSGNCLAEIQEVIKRYGPRHVEFEDDNLTLDKERAREIFTGIEKINTDGYPLSWSTPNGVRIDTLDRPLLDLMKRSNCRSISLGIESGDPDILKAMKKTIQLEKALEVAAIARELRLRVNAFFIIGFPGETASSFHTTLAFANKLKKTGVDVLYHTIARAYPGTPFHDFCVDKRYVPAGAGNNEEIFLGNLLTAENTIQTPDFNLKTLRKRTAAFARISEPWHIRLYQRHHHLIKRIIPSGLIRMVKTLSRRRP
jgi:anaerobic magnesium-protoporphyrin IX monomethyl ester cyclase